MNDYSYRIIEHNGVDCLHVMTETHDAQGGIAHAYIPLDSIQRSVSIYNGMNKIEGDVELDTPRNALQQIQWIAFASRNQIAYWKRLGNDTSRCQEAAFEQIDKLCKEHIEDEGMKE